MREFKSSVEGMEFKFTNDAIREAYRVGGTTYNSKHLEAYNENYQTTLIFDGMMLKEINS